jgi:hypothetical protein
MDFWDDHFSRLQTSLVAQIARIRSGSNHPTIKGTSIEIVLRKVLSEYLPSCFSVKPGQVANNEGNLSPQQDIIVYDGYTFPHLAMNEDSSVIVCCESVLATVECKTFWSQSDIEEHYLATTKVVDNWHHGFYSRRLLSGYFVLYYEPKTPILAAFKPNRRVVGAYCLKDDNSWSLPLDAPDYRHSSANALQTFFQDLLRLCMDIGQMGMGNHVRAYDALSSYFGWKPAWQ